jgi:glutaminyl-peptide cyclotransferase
MEAAVHPALSMFKNDLDSIELFVLLDLLGSANPNVPSYFITTHWAYESMATVESRLRKLRLLKTSPRNMQGQAMFLVDHNMCTANGCDEEDFAQRGSIADDHLPFMARGVQILHMIPSPFPDVWHEIEDDGEHLDLPTVEDWSMIFTGFAAEYLELEGHFPPSAPRKRDSLEASERSSQGVRKRDEL